MTQEKLRFTYLNFGHFLDHLFMLIFAKAAFSAGIAFGLAEDGAYADMIPYGIPSLILFGAGAPLAAYLADKWSRINMMTVFFVGMGLSAIVTGFATSPLQIALGLAAIGLFASIYHPVGIAMIAQGGGRVGWRIGINGVWGNMGVAAAPLITGFILASYSWQLAFILPGIAAVLTGITFFFFARRGGMKVPAYTTGKKETIGFRPGWKRALAAIMLVTSAGGFVFGTMTFIIPRMFEVSLPGVTSDVATTGLLAALVYAIAAFAQLLVGRLIDSYRIKPVLFFIALAQPVLIGIMAMQTDYALFFATLVAMSFVFGQIPITDTVISHYVPDAWRAKVMAVKLMLNLVIGALSLMAARYILEAGAGFSGIISVVAIVAVFISLAALILPGRIRRDVPPTPGALAAAE